MAKNIAIDLDRDDIYSNSEHVDIVIFTAIQDLEQRVLHEELSRAGVRKIEPSFLDRKFDTHQWRFVGGFPNQGMLVATKCLNTAGNAMAGIELMSLLRVYKPSLVCFCGIGGSLSPKITPLGSVIIGQRVFWKGFDKISGENIAWEMRSKLIESFHLDDDIVNTYRRRLAELSERGINLNNNSSSREIISAAEGWYNSALSDENAAEDLRDFDYRAAFEMAPKVQIGNILSWDYVLNRRDIRDAVASEDQNVSCVEMESGGLFMAARRSGGNELDRRILTVRGISDLCFRKSDNFWRETSCRNAASSLVDYLKYGYLHTS